MVDERICQNKVTNDRVQSERSEWNNKISLNVTRRIRMILTADENLENAWSINRHPFVHHFPTRVPCIESENQLQLLERVER